MRGVARSKPNPEITGCKREGATRWDCAFFRLHGADVGIRAYHLLCTIRDTTGLTSSGVFLKGYNKLPLRYFLVGLQPSSWFQPLFLKNVCKKCIRCA
jgi:hypothetical protein